MNPAIEIMLQKYSPGTGEEYIQALREILQEIALLGLSRAKFFEKAAFYGGTAMRIMYKLDRFSEDMDFSLLSPNKDFDLGAYEDAIVKELKAYGFESEFKPKAKVEDSAVKSAFLKANTKESLLAVEASPEIVRRTNRSQKLKIKVEIDTDPPPDFQTEVLQLYNPIPYSVKTYVQEDLFAGKMHAVLFREWRGRVKGRDWYDMVWFMRREIKLNLHHLEQRMRASGNWTGENGLTEKEFLSLCMDKIDNLNIESAKEDIEVFLHDPRSVEAWSQEFFRGVAKKIEILQSSTLFDATS